MRQLLLDIAPEWQPSLDNFVIGKNLELVSALRHAMAHSSSERCFFIWGEQGSGKSHLLQACVRSALDSNRSAVYLRAGVPDSASLVAVDDVEELDDVAQVGLFNIYNRLRESGSILLVAGTKAPPFLKLRDDLRTRLGWGLVYQAHALTEEEKAPVLEQHARAKGFVLPREVTQYLLRHGRRDLPSLVGALNVLDELSLRLHRAPSVPLLKEVLQQKDLAPGSPATASPHSGEEEN